MPVYDKFPAGLEEVDVIIAGGGTAGCILASRISDADPKLSVLVIEGGVTNVGEPSIEYPLLFLPHMDPRSKFMKYHAAKSHPSVADRELELPFANVLGGGSSINMLSYSRPYTFDFDAWDISGWSSEEVIPFFKKFETYHGTGKDEFHGKDGPIHISDGRMVAHKVQDDFIAAATKVGFPEVDDLQGIEGVFGSWRNLQCVSPDGKRQDTASQFLLPRLEDGKHPNLHVVLETRVLRITFDNDKRASGVVFRHVKEDGTDSTGDAGEVRARRQVVIAAGTLTSPGILERSGVGRADVLKKAGIPIVAENSAVGEGLQDHNNLILAYKSNLEPEDTLDGFTRGEFDVSKAIQRQDPILSWTAMDTICQVRPTPAQVKALGPDFEKAFEEHWGKEPNRSMGTIVPINGFPGLPPPFLPKGQYFANSMWTTYPFARGHVHITGPDESDPVDVESGFLTGQNGQIDLKQLRYLYKASREIIRRMDLYRGELDFLHPKFPADSAAAVHDGPLEGDITDIEYSAADDEIIDQWIRGAVGTTWHGLGTCRMGGAVDGRLDVKGVTGLKVADLSVIPGNVAANTVTTAMMIGEKAADIIIKDLGLVAE